MYIHKQLLCTGNMVHVGIKEKGRDLTQSMKKAPTPTEKFKKHVTTPKRHQKRLRTDLRRSVWVTIATPPVW